MYHDIFDAVVDFPMKKITYLAGLSDTVNCDLSGFEGCDDSDLATYCEAMLQGNNRVDRMIKWCDDLIITN